MDSFFILWSEEPFVVLGFFAALLIAAGSFAMGAKGRVVHKPLPEPSLLESERRALLSERDREHEQRARELREAAKHASENEAA